MIHIVLFEPEIPQNTGNIMRTCVATNTKLHLIKPLGFSLDDRHLKRSGVDYIKDLDYAIYNNFEDFKSKNNGTYYFLSRYGLKPYTAFDYSNDKKDIYIIFGKESTGIPKTILDENIDYCIRIPTTDKVRALNVSNAVAIMLYEVLRQQKFKGLLLEEPYKKNYLEKK